VIVKASMDGGVLRWEGFVEKVSFERGVKE